VDYYYIVKIFALVVLHINTSLSPKKLKKKKLKTRENTKEKGD